MKKIIGVLTVLVVVAGLAFAGGSGDKSSSGGAAPAAKPVTLRLAHFGSETHPMHTAAKQFAANVEKRTNGAIKIEIFPNNVLGGPPQILEQMFLGSIDMSLSGQDQIAKHVPLFDCVAIPFSISGYDHMDRVLDGPFLAWATPEIAKKGAVMLSSWEWGFRQVTNSRHPILTPADVQGLKIRTPPAMAYQAAMEALGANVQTIDFSELVMAMRQGVVDGQENPIATIYDLKLYESQKYITMVNYLYSSCVHLVNQKVWDKLSAEQQKIIREESDAARLVARKGVRDAEAAQIADMKSKGIQVDTPDLKPFADKMGPAYAKIRQNIGAENFDKWMEMAKATAK
ncbi:MAG: TRAP transporter substrate-binding protein [Spirochaetaceae bacterium]|jgi:tripartite ATP-independent transporter DctP family solute receptor|nr:TRAP transporter substrate-binding protein [Spirochaetaceae bacterium]